MSRSCDGNGKTFVTGGGGGQTFLLFDFSLLIHIALLAIIVLQAQIML